MIDDPFGVAGVDVFRVNFQAGATLLAPGYAIDTFDPFGLREDGFVYGWVTEASVLDGDGTTATPIDAALYPAGAVMNRAGGVVDSYDPRLRSFAHFDRPDYPAGDGARTAWELAVAPGWYEVTAAIGDVAGPVAGQSYRFYVEGVLVSSFDPTPDFRTEKRTTIVEVTDGFLTLSAQGGVTTRIQHLEVRPLVDLTPDDDRPAPDDYARFRDLRAAAQDGDALFETTLQPETGFAAGVDTAVDIFIGVSVVEGRGGVALQSLEDGSIRLFETLTGDEVAIGANTTAAGDSITVSPVERLKPFTSYTLVVDGATDRGANDDSDGPRPFQKLSTTFVTGDDRVDAARPVAFADRLQIDGAADGAFGFASITLSPDRDHLYVSTLGGEIIRWALDPATGELLGDTRETFTPGGDFETASGRRAIIGLAFDPEDPSVLWVTDNWPIPLSGRDNSVPDFSGRVSKVTLGHDGALETATVTPYLTGLPRSNGDHVTNSLAFRVNPEWDEATNPTAPKHLLYLTQGSNSAMGAPDSAWGFRPERLMSAAVLEIDPRRDPPPGGFDLTTEPLPDPESSLANRRFDDPDGDLKNGGIAIDSGPFDGAFLHFDANGVATVRAGADADSDLIEAFYDPFAPGAVAQIFADGARNAYDLLWHSNGSLYVPTNGSAAGGRTPDDPRTPEDERLFNAPIQPDLLFRIDEAGGFFGHPNPLRDTFVLNGGNPTEGPDPLEVAGLNGYEPGIAPDPLWDPDRIYSLGFSRSANGVAEYQSDVWGAALQNAIVVVEYSGGNDIRALVLDDQGFVIDDFALRDFSGQIINRYRNPLDVVADETTGRLYVSTLNRNTGESQIVLLAPESPPMRIEAEDFTIISDFFVRTNGWASGASNLRAAGEGEARAQTVFAGPAGFYDLTLGYFDEEDGISRMAIFVDDVAIDAFLWDEMLGDTLPRATVLTSRTVTGVPLTPGSVIEIRGFSDLGENLETDYLDIIASATGPSALAPVNTAPSSVTTTINAPFSFSGMNAVSVSDADSDRLTTTLMTTGGVLSLGASTAAVVVTDEGATTTISGTQAEVNTALAGLMFTPETDFLGDVTITVVTSDGSQADIDVIDLSVAPFGDPDATIAVASLEPSFFENRLHFNYIDNPTLNSAGFTRGFKDTGIIDVSNTGVAPLIISGFEIEGPFQLSNPAQLTDVTLQPGQSIAVEVAFDRASHTATPNNSSGVFTGALRILSNDKDANVTTIDLAGFWQDRPEGGWEANVNEIWEVFGFGNRIPDLSFRDPWTALDTGGLFAELNDFEVLSPYWRIADGFEEARVTLIARYSGIGEEVVRVHRPFSKGQSAVEMSNFISDTQTVLPRIEPTSVSGGPGATFDPVFSSFTFTNETIPNVWQGDNVFGILSRNFSTDPSLNAFGEGPSDPDPTAVYGHWMRVFQAIDADGNEIPNTFLGIYDFLGLNFDFNDHMLVFEGVAPASFAPVQTAPEAITLSGDESFIFTGADAVSVTDADPPALTRQMNSFIQASNGTLSVTPVDPVTVEGQGSDFLVIRTGQVGTSALNLLNQTLASLVYTPNPGFSGVDTLRITTNDGALSDVSEIAITVTPGTTPLPFRIEAEDFELVQGFTVATGRPIASGEALIESLSEPEAIARHVFAAAEGVYSITIGYHDQNRGVASMAVVVNGIEIDRWDWDQDLGSNVSPATLVERVITDVALREGDVVELRGFRATGEPVRTDYVDFAFDRPLDDDAPPVAFRVEAEAFALVEGFVIADRPMASGGQLIESLSAPEAVAQHVFSGDEGFYTLSVGYYDQNRGVASMAVFVNGLEIDRWDWDEDLGSNASPETLAERVIEDVALREGDVLELRGFRATGEPVRTDYVDFVFDRPFGDELPPIAFRVEAETFELVEGFTVADRPIASGGGLIESFSAPEAIARHVFAADDGIYDLAVGYYDQNRGVASMAVLLNDLEIDRWDWDEDLGPGVGPATLVERAITNVALREGDVLELRGFRDSGDPVRTDYVDFLFVDDLMIA